MQPPTINATVTVLRFFKVTLDRPETTRRLVFVYEPRKLPRVLAPEEVLRLLEAAPSPKHKAALSVAYGAGLRAMEVVALKVSGKFAARVLAVLFEHDPASYVVFFQCCEPDADLANCQ